MSKGQGTCDARERLAAAVEEMAHSETFAAWLRARGAFHDYSFNNVCLIVSQRPDATQVAGYRTWQKLGRQVRKGEVSRGCLIDAGRLPQPAAVCLLIHTLVS